MKTEASRTRTITLGKPRRIRRKTRKRSRRFQFRVSVPVPLRCSSPIPELNFVTSTLPTPSDRKFAITLLQNTEENASSNFFRVFSPNEIFGHACFRSPMGKLYLAHPFTSTAKEVPPCLVRMFLRSDQILAFEHFMELMCIYLELEYPCFDFTDAMELYYVASTIALYHCNRRLENVGLRGKQFPQNARGGLLPSSHRKIIAKDWAFERLCWPWAAQVCLDGIRSCLQRRLLSVEYSSKNKREELPPKIEKFREKNEAYWNARAESPMVPLRLALDITETEEMLYNNDHEFFQQAFHVMLCDWNEIPPSFPSLCYLCRAKKALSLKITAIGDEDVVRIQEESEFRPVKVAKSIYKMKANATTVMTSPEEPFALDTVIQTKPPSLCSMSGFSSVSGPSTATISPHDWLYNWKTQPMHAQMEHRFMLSGFSNEATEAELASLEFSSIVANELEERIAQAQEHFSSEQMLFAQENLRRLSDVTENSRYLRDFNTEDENENLVNLAVRSISRTFEAENSTTSRLEISRGWQNIVSSQIIQVDEALATLPNVYDSWVADSPYTISCTVPPCHLQDIVSKEPKNNLGPIYSVDIAIIIVSILITIAAIVTILT